MSGTREWGEARLMKIKHVCCQSTDEEGWSSCMEGRMDWWAQWTTFMELRERPGNMGGSRTQKSITSWNLLYVDGPIFLLHTSLLKCDWFYWSDSCPRLVLPAPRPSRATSIMYALAHIPKTQTSALCLSEIGCCCLVTPLKDMKRS